MRITKTTLVTLIMLVASGSAFAQDRKPLPPDEQNKYVISAKAGVINLIEGDVSYKRDKADWSNLLTGDELREGDTVRTGADGRAEILLTPGCYLRLAENTEFLLSDTSIYRFAIDLRKGSAIVEASALDGFLKVRTAQTEFSIIRVGLYRFAINSEGKSEVAVRKGRVIFANALIKGDKKATLENGSPVIAALDKKAVDSFDTWSKGRAQTLIAANKRLSNRGIKRSLTTGFISNMWIRDSSCGCYTFLPYTAGFSSPYGWDYSVCNPYWYRAWNYPSYGRGGYGGGTSGSSPSSGGGSGGGTPGMGSGGGRPGGGVGGGAGASRPGPIDSPGRGRTDPGERGGGRWSDSGRERPVPVGGRRP
jgi:hypothetical protein